MTFQPEDRVQTHPATDAWMRGARYGTVEKVTKQFVHVRLDATGTVVRFSPENLLPIC